MVHSIRGIIKSNCCFRGSSVSLYHVTVHLPRNLVRIHTQDAAVLLPCSEHTIYCLSVVVMPIKHSSFLVSHARPFLTELESNWPFSDFTIFPLPGPVDPRDFDCIEFSKLVWHLPFRCLGHTYRHKVINPSRNQKARDGPNPENNAQRDGYEESWHEKEEGNSDPEKGEE